MLPSCSRGGTNTQGAVQFRGTSVRTDRCRLPTTAIGWSWPARARHYFWEDKQCPRRLGGLREEQRIQIK